MSHPIADAWPSVAAAALAGKKLPVVDPADGVTKLGELDDMLARSLATDDLGWMPAAITTLDDLAADDRLFAWDDSLGALVPVTRDALLKQLLGSEDVSWMAALANLAAVDAAADHFLVVDASATGKKIKRLAADELLKLLNPAVTHRTASATLSSGDAFTIQTNVGASATVQLGLWNPSANDRISFVRRAAYELRLAPASGLKVGEGDTNAVLTMLTEGRLNLRCYDAGHWVVESHSAEYDYV